MPQVASDWKSQGLNRLLQPGGKQTHTSASPKTTPFDSILDETARPAPEPRKQGADDNSPRPERGQRAKSADRADRAARPDRSAKSDDRARPSEPDAPAKAVAAVATVETDAAPSPAPTVETDFGDKPNDKLVTTDNVGVPGQQLADLTAANIVPALPIAVAVEPAAPAMTSEPADTDLDSKAETPAIPAVAAPAQTPAGKVAATTMLPVASDGTEAPSAIGAKQPTAAAATSTPVAKAAIAVAGQADAPDADISGEIPLSHAQPAQVAAAAPKADKTEKADKNDFTGDTKSQADRKAASTQIALKPAATPDLETTQAANGEPAKEADAHPRAETTGASHRGSADTASATVTNDGKVLAATLKAPDLLPPSGLTVPAHSAAAPAHAAAMPTMIAAQADQSDAAVPIANVAFEITGKVLSGRNQFDIRLDPPDLGRIHVRLDVDRDGNVITHMVADRTDTLDMLRKDTASLERALQDAGLKTSDNSLQFSLRDQQANQQQRNSGGESAHVVIEDEQLAATEPAQRNYTRYGASAGGLDIRV